MGSVSHHNQSIKQTHPKPSSPCCTGNTLNTQLHVVYLSRTLQIQSTQPHRKLKHLAILNTVFVKSRLWPHAAQPWNRDAIDYWLNAALVSQLWLGDDAICFIPRLPWLYLINNRPQWSALQKMLWICYHHHYRPFCPFHFLRNTHSFSREEKEIYFVHSCFCLFVCFFPGD